jgi:hypothetical protein
LVASSGCTGTSTEQFDFAGKCPPPAKLIPSPWTFSTKVDNKDYFYGGFPHFSAPLSAFGVAVAAPATEDHKNIFVAIRRCGGRDGEDYASTPCGTFERLSAGQRADSGRGVDRAVVVNDVRVENFPYLTAARGDFVGQCTGRSIEQLAQDGGGTCRAWVADANGERGLYIVVSGQALPSIAALVQRAKILLDPSFGDCALGVGDRR